MILSDFLSRQKIDDSNPHEIILISFNMREVLQERYYNLYNMRIDGKYLVQTRSQTKSSGTEIARSTWSRKTLDWIGQGRAGIRREVEIVPPLQTPEATQSLSETMTKMQDTVQTEHKSTAQTDIRQPVGPRIEMKNPILP